MELEEVLEQCLGQNFVHMIISNPKKGDFAGKVDVRCYEDKGTLMFQFARYQNNQVFHLNYAKEEAKNYILSELVPIYRQMQFFTTEKQYTILISKKGKITIKGKNKKSEKPLVLSHNRKKKYILPENEPIPFLIELGVQAEDGRIRDKKQKKFRQINRFLEFIRDVSDKLPKDKELTIVDFGCGKSYLTFAMYYYLKIIVYCRFFESLLKIRMLFKVEQMEYGVADKTITKTIAVNEFGRNISCHVRAAHSLFFKRNKRKPCFFRSIYELIGYLGQNIAYIHKHQRRAAFLGKCAHDSALLFYIVFNMEKTRNYKFACPACI